MMEWFRWYHGTMTDPKFQWVARHSGQNVAAVLGVWGCLLERASQEGVRGTIAGMDYISVDTLLGLEDGACGRIMEALAERGLIRDGVLTNWQKRQPVREDPTAINRKRRQRERVKQSQVAGAEQMSLDSGETEGPGPHVEQTGGSAPGGKEEACAPEGSRNVTPRGDQTRGDQRQEESSLCSDSFPQLVSPSIPPLPLNNGEKHVVLPEEVARWQTLYPAVDVMQEIRSMYGWLEANPRKRKTAGGINRFIQGWLRKCQDRGGSQVQTQGRGWNGQLTPYQRQQEEQRALAAALLQGERELHDGKQEENFYGIGSLISDVPAKNERGGAESSHEHLGICFSYPERQ